MFLALKTLVIGSWLEDFSFLLIDILLCCFLFCYFDRFLEINQCEDSSFKLAEEILNLNPDFLSRLLKLFSSKVLHLTQHSLKTLVHLCQYSNLHDELGYEVSFHSFSFVNLLYLFLFLWLYLLRSRGDH